MTNEGTSFLGPLNPLYVHRVRMDSNICASTRPKTSQERAEMAAMNHDTVSAALWALSSFDPALVHLAELREKFAHLDPEEDPIRITLDRLTAVYVEGQCQELLHGAGITTHEANNLVDERIGNIDKTSLHILDTSGGDPLALELLGYALWLAVLTAHGTAPWNRFAAVMADCYHQRHPSLAKA